MTNWSRGPPPRRNASPSIRHNPHGQREQPGAITARVRNHGQCHGDMF